MLNLLGTMVDHLGVSWDSIGPSCSIFMCSLKFRYSFVKKQFFIYIQLLAHSLHTFFINTHLLLWVILCYNGLAHCCTCLIDKSSISCGSLLEFRVSALGIKACSMEYRVTEKVIIFFCSLSEHFGDTIDPCALRDRGKEQSTRIS